jgi:ABC toxin-like protein
MALIPPSARPVQPDLIRWGVIDADSLFEFFLIDVQMDACMQTSRIKQAISSVQLFIQRCLLGLEEKRINGTEVGVPNDGLDRNRWDWMQRYRVWEANRKVFCYPENWVDPLLRDDKSSFFKELESELLQKDINTQTVEDALKSYLFKVDEVGHLQVLGLF